MNRTVLVAWTTLILTSGATTLVAAMHWHGAPAILALAALMLVKSRIILSDYLCLAGVPAIRGGFMFALTLWAIVASVLAIFTG